ncbi:MAG: DegV family protein [Butyrivibrio sp.]
MRPYQIITDTNSDLPKSYVIEKNLIQVPQYTLLEGVTYEGAEGIDPADFYNKMKDGVEPQSQAINPAVTEEKFRLALDAGKDVLYISFASTLSGSCNTAMMVAKNLQEEYTDAKIIVVDTLAASLGEGLLVMKAVEMQEDGKDIEEVASWLEDNKTHVIFQLTVDDLHHLQRGGRVSKTSAVVGSLIGVKPIMHITADGKLEAAGTVRGRKKAIASLVDEMEKKNTVQWKALNKRVGIAHGNCYDEAVKLADTIKEKFGIEEVIINDINPSIGVHSGPGAILLSFFGTER